MTKTEFLKIMDECLQGNIPRAEIEDNLRFYNDYFAESGKSEGEVCDELGDPRLISRTIIDTFVASKGPMADAYQQQARSEYSEYSTDDIYSQRDSFFGQGEQVKWYDRILGNLILALILIAVVVVILVILRITVTVIVPVILIVIIIKFILDFIRRH